MHTKSSRTVRCRVVLAAALAGLIWTTTAATAQTPAEQPEKPTAEAAEKLKLEARRLVRRLDDRQLAVRDGAEKELIGHGPAILPWLPEIADTMPEEVKHRLTRIRQKVERAAAEQTAQSTRVTFSGQATPLSLVLAAIEQQTGNKISFRNAQGEQINETPVTVDFKETFFWSALDQVLDQANLTVYHFSQEPSLNLTAKNPGLVARYGRASYDGPFRIEVLRARAVRDLRAPANRSLRLEIEVAWEPRLSPIAMSLPLEGVRAEDGRGNLLSISGRDTDLSVEVQSGTTAVELELPFDLPPRSATKVSKLTGVLHALVPGRVERFRFDNIEAAEQVEQRKGGVTVILESVRKNNDLWDVSMRVRYDQATGALESHRGWVYRNARYILNAEGERVEDLADEMRGQSETEIAFAFAYDLPDGPQGVSFVYETPAVILRMPIKFELTDIDLP